MTNPDVARAVAEISKRLVDEGKIIEAGWVNLRMLVISPDAPPIQIEEMRTAFFAGAQHLLGSIMSIMEPGAEPTDKDLARMDHIDAELGRFIEEFKAKHPELAKRTRA